MSSISPTDFKSLFLKQFPFDFTEDQRKVANMLYKFTVSTSYQRIGIIKGYAGTGKTTIMGAYIRTIHSIGLKTKLMAPTGRAAKVLENSAKFPAQTIHRLIYQKTQKPGGGLQFSLRKNRMKNTVFIVDEASMISDQNQASSLFQSDGNLLNDLLNYVFDGVNCSIIFLGDDAQLPPVESPDSPALQPQELHYKYDAKIFYAEMREVLRQELDSGILNYATQLRHAIDRNQFLEAFQFQNHFPDVSFITSNDFPEYLDDYLRKYGEEGYKIVTWSNQQSLNYNQLIRHRIKYLEEKLEGGDQIMCVKNNYYWTKVEQHPMDFIANGEEFKVLSVKNIEEKYGFEFADIIAQPLDHSDTPEIQLKVIIDSLFTEGPSLKYEQQQKLFHEVERDHQHIHMKGERNKAVFQSPYLNALQIKFSHAVTCHKSQGGQWPIVFIRFGFFPGKSYDASTYRWMYTALTRAQEKVFILNYPVEEE